MPRPLPVIQRFASLIVLVVAAGLAPAQIAYVKDNSLYVLPCDTSGKPTKAAFRVCRLWKHYRGDGVELRWTPNHRILLTHYVDAWNGPKRLGLSQTSPASGVSIVDAMPNAKIQYLTEGNQAVVTPDGLKLIVAIGNVRSDLWTIDLRTHRRELLVQGGGSHALSQDGKLLAYVRTDHLTQGEEVQVLRLSDKKVIRSFPPAVNPIELRFSPDGRYLAIHYHLSRPMTGHEIFSLKTGATMKFETPEKYAPSVIDDWSPYGSKTLCSWRIVNPDNDGSSSREFVGLMGVGKATQRNLAMGNEATFTREGAHFLFLTDHVTGRMSGLSDLMWQSIDGRRAIRLIRGVAGFAVYRSTGAKPGTIYYLDPADI